MILTILMLIILILTILMLIILMLTISSGRLLAATTLRNVLGTLNLGDILSQREIIAKEMQVEKSHTNYNIFGDLCVISLYLSRTPWWRALLPGESRLSESR